MNSPETCVRAAVAGDVAAVIALERQIVGAPHWNGADYAAILHRGSLLRCLFIAEFDGKFAGFAVGKVIEAGSEALAELESVVVGVELRRKGIGAALCEAVVDWCRVQGAAVIELEVRAANSGAIALYERLGFEPVGRRRGYYREPVDDALLMRLKLV